MIPARARFLPVRLGAVLFSLALSTFLIVRAHVAARATPVDESAPADAPIASDPNAATAPAAPGAIDAPRAAPVFLPSSKSKDFHESSVAIRPRLFATSPPVPPAVDAGHASSTTPEPDVDAPREVFAVAADALYLASSKSFFPHESPAPVKFPLIGECPPVAAQTRAGAPNAGETARVPPTRRVYLESSKSSTTFTSPVYGPHGWTISW
mgnify:CR=1 FL=1